MSPRRSAAPNPHLTAGWKLALGNGLVLAGLLTVAWLSRTYYYCFCFGPFPADDAALLAAAAEPGDGSLLSYVEIRDHRLIPTGWTEEMANNGKVYSVTPYFLTPVGDRFLLVQTERQPPAAGQPIVGPLFRVAADVEAEVVAGIVRKQPEYRGRILPVMVNAAAAFPVIGWIGIVLGVPLATLALGYFVVGLHRWARG